MTTDNRTNEMIVAEAMADAGAPLMHSRVEEVVVEALRTAGRLAGEPTEAQIEAAAKAIADCHNPGMFERYPENWRVEARAALEAAARAAQGIAPQAEAYDHCCQHPKCPGGSLCCCASEQRLRDCWNQWREEIAGDSKQAFRDGYQAGQNDPAPWLTAPVLPSSG